MYVVTVEFTIDAAQRAAFLPLMFDNARRSRETETGCRQFDVCADDGRPATIFLYEIYDDRAAFDIHLASPHFIEFSAATRTMVLDRRIETWHRIAP